MNQYRCLIVDDEQLGRELIAAHLGQLEQFTLVASCASAIEAAEILANEPVDLMFLDIEMPVLKGTDFYKNLSRKPDVIFTTAYRDYAVEGFEVEAIDYLLKPITFARFFRAVERFLSRKRQNTQPNESTTTEASIFVRANRKDVRLLLKDIRYVQGLKDYVCLYTEESVFTVKETMRSLAQRLGHDFVRVHKSFIVNRSQVTAITAHDVEIGDLEIPIGETFKPQIAELFGVSG